MCKYYYFGLKQHREKQYAFKSYFLYRSNPYKVNEAILVFGDVHGQVNALLFSAATMALFDRPSQPAGSKQGTVTSPGEGGYFRNLWVGMCRWDPGTLNLYQS